jgi:hypothetical protein
VLGAEIGTGIGSWSAQIAEITAGIAEWHR